MSKRLIGLALISLLPALSLGWAGGLAGTPVVPPDAQTVSISAKDNFFEPKAITVKGGEPIALTFKNDGKEVHDVEVTGYVGETKLQTGQSCTWVFTPTTGTVKLYCELHDDVGMVGTLLLTSRPTLRAPVFVGTVALQLFRAANRRRHR